MKNVLAPFTSYFPTIGILVFFLLFWYSSTFYPGGNQTDLNAVGFDWYQNYWCNLTNELAMNDEINPARPYAITALVILCFSLMVFFIQFSEKTSSKFWRRSIKVGGVLSMTFAVFMFTDFHDFMIILASFFGFIVVIGVIWQLYLSDLTLFKVTGIVCIILLAINNYIYYTDSYIRYLPFIQKITFLVVLFWIVGLNVKMNKLETIR
jgi:hypothetical protein